MDRRYTRCTICGEWHWSNTKCKPVFYVQIPDYHGDEWDEVRAFDYTEAAEKYCDLYDSDGDNDILINGGLDKIFVKNIAGNVKIFSVVAEARPTYIASERKSEKCSE
jgi:hypothetical protein